jgi:hypothetical protein
MPFRRSATSCIVPAQDALQVSVADVTTLSKEGLDDRLAVWRGLAFPLPSL